MDRQARQIRARQCRARCEPAEEARLVNVHRLQPPSPEVPELDGELLDVEPVELPPLGRVGEAADGLAEGPVHGVELEDLEGFVEYWAFI